MHCSFCYLTDEQRRSSILLNLHVLRERIEELIMSGCVIRDVDIYGGEVSILDERYLNDLFDLIKDYTDKINVVTNLLVKNPALNRKDIGLSVSFDMEVRPQWRKVMGNLLTTYRDVSVLMLATPELVGIGANNIVDVMNILQSVKSVEVKPYSPNQNNWSKDTDGGFVQLVKGLIKRKDKKFDFVNEKKIQECLNGTYNAFSNDHIYITPSGGFAVLDFDKDDKEFFQEIELDEYWQWCKTENRAVCSGEVCRECEFKGHCLTEHYRHHTCSGFPELLN